MAAALAGFAGCAASEYLLERNGLGNCVVNGNHFAVLAIEECVNCKRAELGAKASVVLTGLATTLGVTDIGCANLLAAEKLLEENGWVIKDAVKAYIANK